MAAPIKVTDTQMSIYEMFRSVPKEAQKTIGAGKLKGFTDINPMWRIKMLTEAFGPCGLGWYVEILDQWSETYGDNQTAAFVKVALRYRIEPMKGEWSAPVVGIGGSILFGKGVGDGINDEAYKMAYTDAISIACKNLGMCADIYYDKDKATSDNRTKYDVQNAPKEKVAPAAPQAEKPAYKPMSEERYQKYVQAAAAGQTSNGKQMLDIWRDATHAGEEEVKKFLDDVANVAFNEI